MKPPAAPQSAIPASLIAQSVHNGQVRVRGRGMRADVWLDVYHRMLRMPWRVLVVAFAALFMAFNLGFAVIYALDPHGLATNGPPLAVPPFWRGFFFSVHTVATIGYGNVVPVTMFTNVVVVIEITAGILMFALATGIIFARFSRPTARILFSRRAVIRDVDGVPTLMLRAANQRHNMIYSVTARVSLLVDADFGGAPLRRFVDVPLVRSSHPAFALTWLMMHQIDAASPLAPWLVDRQAPGDAELIVVLSGTDEASGQTLHGRWVYGGEDVVWDARFADIIETAPDGWRIIHYERFHDVVFG